MEETNLRKTDRKKVLQMREKIRWQKVYTHKADNT